MRRPSFQFYPGDYVSNPNLRRCTFEQRGVWVEVLCLLHSQDEYGIVRWPLKDLAQAVGCPAKTLQDLAEKGVLKGADVGETCAAFTYAPRSGRQAGPTVTLIPAQDGPIWYSSRMVRDEHVRQHRGEGSRFRKPLGKASGDDFDL